MTDREIIDFIKKDIINGDTANFLTLDIKDKTGGKMHCFSNYFSDEMFTTLFDLSMTKEVIGIGRNRLDPTSRTRAYNGTPTPIYGYIIVVEESKDCQTNITPRLMKFIEVIMNRGMLDRLAFPMRHSREIEFHDFGVGGFVPIAMPPPDPWDAVEAYLNEGEREEEAVSDNED